MGALTTEQVLREEAAQFCPDEREKGLTALCLSGGGIRSAAFALGIIQALATHPRPSEHESVKEAENSLLGQFHYLSTVSGGGYIGCWLSAWIHRTCFRTVWEGLTRRSRASDDEAPPIAWLRSYSNYLTPKLGIMSADTWAAAALFVRNMLLNWLVIIPPLCVVVLVVKLVALGIFWAHNSGLPVHNWIAMLFVAVAVLLLGYGLRTALKNRPTAFNEGDYRTVTPQEEARLKVEMPRQKNERKAPKAPGIDDKEFAARILLPTVGVAVLAVTLFSANLKESSSLTHIAAAAAVIYALAMLLVPPWDVGAKPKPSQKRRLVRLGEFVAWIVAGSVFGVGVWLGLKVLNGLDLAPLQEVVALIIVGSPWIITARLAADLVFVGLTSKQERSDQDREWFGRSSGWFAAIGLGWLVFVSLVVLGPMLVQWVQDQDHWPDFSKVGTLIGTVSGIISAVLGHSSSTKARNGEQGWLALSLNLVLAVTVPIFLASLIIGLSAGLDWLLLRRLLFTWWKFPGGPIDVTWEGFLCQSTWLCLVLGLLVALVIGGAASWFVNINWFSLHALYRNRLIRAFLGASCSKRLPNPFTGFDQKDNPQVVELWPHPKGSWQPFHVINIALNLVSSKRLAWQERKAASFTVTPLHCGYTCDSETCAYRRTVEYGHPKKVREKEGNQSNEEGNQSKEEGNQSEGVVLEKCGISLGTAMAISGAAASPNMGYHSSPSVSLILALFNVRLGWWLGNPGELRKKTFCGPLSRKKFWRLLRKKAFRRFVRKKGVWHERQVTAYKMESPRWALRPSINELFGLTSEDRPFVYLSDGGHFENLGLYEMVRRRCKYIVVSDAGCDPGFAFEDLGNAIRKIWIDLGVKITFYRIHALKSRVEEDLHERQSGTSSRPTRKDDGTPLFAVGRIDYDHGDEKGFGYILYVKAAYHRSAVRNVGVRSYAMAHPSFPHESTMDQFFSESQFESYRALGFESMDEILKKGINKLGNRKGIEIGQIIDGLWDETDRLYPINQTVLRQEAACVPSDRR